VPARSPEEVVRLVGDALTAGDIEALMAMYEPGATLVAQPGQHATGSEALRQVLSAFIALKPSMTVKSMRVVPAGDVALVMSEWSLQGTGPDGKAIAMGGHSTDVARRQSDGTWRMVIDNPWGTA
jgi:uncharacterized protein (TIGR02246 family)